MAERTTKPVCPVCSALLYEGCVVGQESPVTDCAHLRLLAASTRGHRAEWEGKRG